MDVNEAAASPRIEHFVTPLAATAQSGTSKNGARAWHERCSDPGERMMESRDHLMAELALIDRQLQASDETTSDLVEALLDVARALKLPVDARREDAHRFIEGTESVATATWAQCGGLVFALTQRQVVEERALAAQVAQRLFELTPTHYAA